MDRTLAVEVVQHAGKKISVRGWLHQMRSFGKLHFLILRDRSGLCQIVIQDEVQAQKVEGLQPGSILHVTGEVELSQKAELGVEVVHPEITVEVPILDPPPLEYYKPRMLAHLESILDYRSVALRHVKIQAVFRIQAKIAHAYRLFMHDRIGAFEYFSPNIIGTSSEGGAEFFNVDYFGYTATLAQSSQLYKQIMVGVNERVFAVAPFFRAEPSHTPRHLSEGKQLEFEIGFFQHWHEILDIQEAVIKFIVKTVHAECQSELAALDYEIIKAPENVPFPRLTFQEALELYYQRTGIDERAEDDLSPAAERDLCKYALEEYGTDLIFITDWKTVKRPFYSHPNGKDPEITNTFDLLCAGTEITSGGQRRHTYSSMLEGLSLKGMDPSHFTDYLDVFKYGMPPHGGFGMGLERLTMTLLKLKNIREASLFPSDPKMIASSRIKAKVVFGEEGIRNEMIHLLKKAECPFEHLIHAPSPTSEESARLRGTTLAEGVKALILRGKDTKKNYQFNLSSHLKLDMKAVSALVGEKCEFEDPSVIKERFGLTIGGIPPFGQLLNIETFFDEEIMKQPRACFNCGLLTESIIMRSQDLVAIVQPKIAAFSKL